MKTTTPFPMNAPKKDWTSKILIVEDHELVREGLLGLINRQDDIEVCGEATTVEEAHQMVAELVPNIVIVDLCLPDASGLDLVKWIMDHHPATKIIVSTMHQEREYGERVLRLGAMGFVNKQKSASLILVAIRSVLNGELFFSSEFTNKLLQRVSTQAADLNQPPTAILSDRELEVLEMIAQGLTTKMIARRLFLSHNTIGTYRDRLKVKLNLKNSTELMHFAIRWLEK